MYTSGTYQLADKAIELYGQIQFDLCPYKCTIYPNPLFGGTYNPNSDPELPAVHVWMQILVIMFQRLVSRAKQRVSQTYNPNVGSSDASECINAEQGPHFVPTSA